MNHTEYLEMTIGDILSRLDRIERRLNAIVDELGAWPAETNAQEACTDTQTMQGSPAVLMEPSTRHSTLWPTLEGFFMPSLQSWRVQNCTVRIGQRRSVCATGCTFSDNGRRLPICPAG